MAKLFGEYLVEKKLIQEQQLVDALVTQLEEQPPAAKVARDLGLLDTLQLLATLKRQSVDGGSFVAAAKALSYWSDDKSTRMTQELASRQTSIGELLVKAKALDLPALTRALDSFLADAPEPELAAAAPPPPPVRLPFADIFEFLSPSWFASMDQVLASVAGAAYSDAAPAKTFTDDLHKVSGAARLFELTPLADFIDKVEKTLRSLVSRDATKVREDILKKLREALGDARTVFTQASDAQKSGAMSTEFFSKSEVASKIQAVSDWCFIIEFDLESL